MIQFTFRYNDVEREPPAQPLVQEFEGEGVGKSWTEVCFIKF